jgi:hypothetical protein
MSQAARVRGLARSKLLMIINVLDQIRARARVGQHDESFIRNYVQIRIFCSAPFSK